MTNTTTGDTTSLTWDGDGRLAGMEYANGNTNTFAYNGLGQRVGKADSTGTFAFSLADDSIDSNVLSDGQATYQYGAGLVSEVRGGASTVYHADSLGTTRAMSDNSGAATATLETDAFGNTVSQSGASASPFGFAGQHGYQTDSDSGLMLLGHRYYDASVGRFISRDPIQAGYNWYTYCNNDPVNAVDPEGLEDDFPDIHFPAVLPPSWLEFDTVLEAVQAILQVEMPKTANDGKERGGSIKKNKDGSFSPYDDVTIGDENGVSPIVNTGDAGIWHTHPPGSPRGSDLGDQHTADFWGMPNYAGDPGGGIIRNKPRPGGGATPPIEGTEDFPFDDPNWVTIVGRWK